MKFLVDAQLPPGLCRWLQARGHEAEHVFALGMAGAPDSRIADRAVETDAILISTDEDFMASGRPALRFLWLRCGNMTSAALSEWLDARWAAIEEIPDTGEALVEAV